MSQNLKLAIKFLISNNLAGSLIGPNGGSIKELIEITEAKVHVSAAGTVYPGTSDRIVYISGPINSVDLAQNLLWDMFAIESLNSKHRTSEGVKQKALSYADDPNIIPWNPKSASENPGEYDTIPNKCKLTIPATAAGAVLGKGGSILKAISDESGAELVMNNRGDSIFTQERILTVSGSTGACAKCVSLILEKLDSNLEDAQYVNNSTRYTTHLENLLPQPPNQQQSYQAAGGRKSLSAAGGRRGGDKSEGGHSHSHGQSGGNGAHTYAIDDIITSTKITLTVPDNMIGNILGKKGAVMKEIMSLSGAKITISERADRTATAGAVTEEEEPTDAGDRATGCSENRTVTISGSPAATQTAHLLITQKLQMSTQLSSQQSSGGGYVGGSRGKKPYPRREEHTRGGGTGRGGSSTSSSTLTRPARRAEGSPAGNDDEEDN